MHIRLPKNPDGQGHKGYSFVTFQHEASVPYAINVMEGTTLFGKKLKLQPRVYFYSILNNPKRFYELVYGLINSCNELMCALLNNGIIIFVAWICSPKGK